uniref:Polynucleotide 5'-hydroxyl-kinase NOL9 n=1 Tax=Jaculus jaculus TaxID=51337 RepID=A0A8C5KU06_JACJA
MAESEARLKLSPGRSTWLRARKARSQVVFSRRCHRRLGGVHRCERRRLLRRRLLQAQAAGADWKESVNLGSDKPTTRKHKASTPSPVPCRVPSPTAFSTPAPSIPAKDAGQLVRTVGLGRMVLMLPAEEGFTFSGVCRVTCLYGQLEIYGHTMSHGQPAQDVFSTYTHAYISINALCYQMPEKSEKEIRREIRALLKPHLKLADRHWVLEHFSPLYSVILLEKLKSPLVNFISSYPGVSSVFLQENPPTKINYEYVTLRSVGIRRQKKKKRICLSESAFSALEELVSVCCVDGCPVILVYGTQDIGKSTFIRYLVNQLLNSISCVDYLECDLGQTEFTPAGCISLLNITEPVLGPPFTHQRTPQKMVYYGKTSCKNDCENYIEIVKYVFSSYKKESPLIINTMGWVTDEGLLLLIDLIRLLSPSHVIQLSSPNSKYMPTLTSEYVDDMDGLYTKSKIKRRYRGFQLPEFGDNLEFIDEEKDSSPVFFTGHKLMCVRSEFFFCSKNARNRDSYNRIFRDLAVLGYLSQLMPPLPKPLSPLHGLTPYQVPFSAVALRIIHSDVAPTHIMYAVNASWVGLCKIVDDMRGYTKGPILLAQNPICDCLGFGICRGIDMEKRLYHILTPLPPEELRTVNCLLIGTVSIPQCILTNQHGLKGAIPYITTDYNFKLPGASEKIGLREKLYP